MIRRTFLLSFCALALWGQGRPRLDARIDAAVRDALRQSGAPSVSVAVVVEGRLAYAQAFGYSSLAPRRAATARTRYAVGSISKQFTAAALLLLQEEGKLSLDDKVSQYFPDLTRAGEITLRQLLSHTSGYEDYAPQDYIIPAWTKATTPQQILDGWARKPLNFDPGARWQYSNTNYVLAASIFEKVSGQKLVAFLRDRIFGPLDMQSAGAWNPGGEEEARAYTRFALGPPRPVAREAAGWYFGAGELAMTPSDLARWDIAFLQKKILSAKSYEEFTREARLNGGGPTRYALGLTAFLALNGTVFIVHLYIAYADLPLAFFTLAGAGLLYLWLDDRAPRGSLTLAACSLAGMAWCKYEGPPLAATLILAAALTLAWLRPAGWLRRLVRLAVPLAGLVAGYLPWRLFAVQHQLEIGADHIQGFYPQQMAQAIYYLLAGLVSPYYFGFLWPALILALILAGRRLWRSPMLFLALVVAGNLAAVILAYAVAPTAAAEFPAYVRATLDRLLLHLTP
ncbi:MAG: beta-lactamase family protein, partial [Acidobacteriia bacterium]|nr:beta-lactamase family protein [Terriglobia bacterium]